MSLAREETAGEVQMEDLAVPLRGSSEPSGREGEAGAKAVNSPSEDLVLARIRSSDELRRAEAELGSGGLPWDGHSKEWRTMQKVLLFWAGFLATQMTMQSLSAFASEDWIELQVDTSSSPILLNKGQPETVLLSFIMIVGFAAIFTIFARFYTERVHLLNSISMACLFVNAILLVILLVEFNLRIQADPAYHSASIRSVRMSSGYWQCLLALCCGVASIALYGISIFVYGIVDLTGRSRQLLLAVTIISFYVPIGGLIFARIEGWTYDRAVVFCIVTVSTIGYGNDSPITAGGRVFLFFYSLIGFTAIGYSIGLIRGVVVDYITIFVHGRLNAAQKRGITHFKSIESKTAKIVNIGIAVLVLLLWFIGALVFWALEDWDYFEALYFCFVTLTTIGYGDFYPRTRQGNIFLAWYVFFGLGMVALILSMMSDFFNKMSNTFSTLALEKTGHREKKRDLNRSSILEAHSDHNYVVKLAALVSAAESLARASHEVEKKELLATYKDICNSVLKQALSEANKEEEDLIS